MDNVGFLLSDIWCRACKSPLVTRNGSKDCRLTWKANLDRILPLIWWMIWAFRLPLLSMSPTMTGKNWAKRRPHHTAFNTVEKMEAAHPCDARGCCCSVPLLDPSALLQRTLLQTCRRSLLRCSGAQCGSPFKGTIIRHAAAFRICIIIKSWLQMAGVRGLAFWTTPFGSAFRKECSPMQYPNHANERRCMKEKPNRNYWKNSI